MARQGKQSPKDRWQQVRLSQRRTKRKAARQGREYDPDRWAREHKPVLNPSFKLKGKVRGTSRIKFPASLDCDTTEDWARLLGLLMEIRTAAFKGNFKRLVLDFSDVASMDPEAAVTVVAEIQRCQAFCARRTQITGTYPRAHDVSALLTAVGFFKALEIKAPVLPSEFEDRTYVQIERNNETVPEVADKLLDCFTEVFVFDDDDRKRLHIALVESMDNVFEHAYPRRSDSPDLLREWWLAGYADHTDRAICFIFYDQGAGIPTTIKARQKARLLRMMAGWSDGQWIERAVRKGVSRHNSKRRGHGLEKLREFVARLDVEGMLRVVANAGAVVFPSNGSSKVFDLNGNLHGTLVVWQLRGVELQAADQSHPETDHEA